MHNCTSCSLDGTELLDQDLFEDREEVFLRRYNVFARFRENAKKIKTENMDSSIAARVKSRSKRKRDDASNEENAGRPSLGERVLFCKLIRDGILKHFDPRKLSDLRHVLELRCFKGLLSDEDMRECYFEGAWGYRSRDFWLDNWREMSVKKMQGAIWGRVRYKPWLQRVFGSESSVRSLRTKDELLRKYGWSRFVPLDVYLTAADGALVLRELRDRGIDEIVKRGVANMYLRYAYWAGLDWSVVCTLADRCGKRAIEDGVALAVGTGYTGLFDLLVEKYGIRVEVKDLNTAVWGGQIAMIDHLVVKYGLDPQETEEALHHAVALKRVHVIRYLVEVCGVDVNTSNNYGRTALDVAEDEGRAECASVLRSYGALTRAELRARGR